MRFEVDVPGWIHVSYVWWNSLGERGVHDSFSSTRWWLVEMIVDPHAWPSRVFSSARLVR